MSLNISELGLGKLAEFSARSKNKQTYEEFRLLEFCGQAASRLQNTCDIFRFQL